MKRHEQPTTAERVEAIEKFLQQLVLLLEVEPDLSRDSVRAWLEVCQAATRARTACGSRQAVALQRLCTRVLEGNVDVVRVA